MGVKEICPDAVYHKDARIILIEREPVEKTGGKILVATGGTSDIPVAEEAALTAVVANGLSIFTLTGFVWGFQALGMV